MEQDQDQTGHKPARPPRRAPPSDRGATIAGLIIMGGAALIALLQVLGIRIAVPNIALPAPFDSTLAQMLIAAGGLVSLVFLGAAILKAIEHRKVQSWRTVPGRIIRSRPGTEITNGAPVTLEQPIADIAYEYEVDGERHVGTRLTLAERIGPREVEDLLRRYSVGESVSVHVDPDDPSSSVLDRDGPKGALLGCLGVLAGASAAGAAAIWLAQAATPALGAVAWGAFWEINGPLILVFGAISGLFLTLAALIAAPVRQVRRWPVTTGRVLSHDIRIRGAGGGSARAHYPIVRYAYTVRGVERQSNVLSHGSTMGGGRGFAEKVLARFPVGSTVRVHYNPDKPEEAALETRFGLFGWITLTLGLVFALMALAVTFA